MDIYMYSELNRIEEEISVFRPQEAIDENISFIVYLSGFSTGHYAEMSLISNFKQRKIHSLRFKYLLFCAGRTKKLCDQAKTTFGEN